MNYRNFEQKRNSYYSRLQNELNTAYGVIALDNQKDARIVFDAFINKPEILELYKQARSTDEARRAFVRMQLLENLGPLYERLKMRSVRQLHFHLPNSESFLRFHRPEKYGDSLKGVRYSVDKANAERVAVSGFEEGRIVNGFRNVFPIIYQGEHLGSVEISMCFDDIRKQMEQQFHNRYAFAVRRRLVEETVFKDERKNYQPSDFSDDYIYEQGHAADDALKAVNAILKPKIQKRLHSGEPFAMEAIAPAAPFIVVFHPVKNVEGKQAAYIVSYNEDNTIRGYYAEFIVTLAVSIAGILAIVALMVLLTNALRRLRVEKKELAKEALALRKSERFLQDMFDAIQDHISVLDTDLNIIKTNRWIEQAYAHQMPLTGKKCYQAYQMRQSPCPWCPSLPSMETGETHSAIVPVPSEDDPTGWTELFAFPMKDEQGRVTGVIEYGKDITERRRAEDELHNEREKLFVTLRSIGDGVITADTEGRVAFFNSVAEELTGWRQEEAMGRPLAEVFNIINEKTDIPADNPVKKVLDSGLIVGLANHTALIARDGTRRSIADSGAPIRDAKGKTVGVVLAFRDVTELKRREEEALKIKKLESVGILAGGIAHDFNNILTAILGNISLAGLYVEKDNKAHRLLTEAEKASIRAKDLTRQLLTFSKGGDPVKETASIKEVITDSADFVLHGSNVVCRCAIADDLWLVDIDRGQMSQVIQNIVLNARHAMPEGGSIAISCENIADAAKETALSLPQGKYIKITIADTGYGIPEKYLDKIFDPYFTTKQEGSGLGLAITHSIIAKHDGYIAVRSKSGEGTTFTIYLPASAKQTARDGKEPAPEKTAHAVVLVMDDEEIIRNLAKDMLAHFGHEVLLAKDGQEAVAVFRENYHSDHPVDVVIMDLTVPGGMGGQEAVSEILKIDPDARAIVSSGYANDPVMADYHRYGFKAALSKPFKMANLHETISAVLEDREAQGL
jgi:PAS domain S-box-containing protein